MGGMYIPSCTNLNIITVVVTWVASEQFEILKGSGLLLSQLQHRAADICRAVDEVQEVAVRLLLLLLPALSMKDTAACHRAATYRVRTGRKKRHRGNPRQTGTRVRGQR